MSWLHAYEITVPFYELRRSKYYFSVQFRLVGAPPHRRRQQFQYEDEGEEDEQEVFTTAWRSYSQFRAVWKELLRVTKGSLLTTSTAALLDGTTSFPRFVKRQHSQEALIPQYAAAPGQVGFPYDTEGPCACSKSFCPFSRLHRMLKTYPFPSKIMLKRNTMEMVEARRHALERFVVCVREFFISFPHALLQTLDSNDRCRVLDVFASFVGYRADLLPSMERLSQQPTTIASWKTESQHALMVADRQDRSSSDTVDSFLSGHDEHDYDEGGDDYEDDIDFASNQLEYDGGRPLLGEIEPGPASFLVKWGENQAADEPMLHSDLDMPSDEDEGRQSELQEEHASQRARVSAAYVRAPSAVYSRSSSNSSASSTSSVDSLVMALASARPQTLPKLQIRSARVKTMRSFFLQYRDHLLQQFRAHNFDDLVIRDAEISEEQQWEIALYVASHVGNAPAVQAILARGTSPNAQVTEGSTSLHAAARSGHNDIVKLLLEYGADVNAADFMGMTSLLLAINNGFMDVLRLLLTAGADVNQCNCKNVSTAHVAVACQSLPMLSLLMEHNAFVNTANAVNGKTPLHIAAETGNGRICDLLLKHGANPRQCDDHGMDACSIAKARRHFEVVDLCRKYDERRRRSTACGTAIHVTQMKPPIQPQGLQRSLSLAPPKPSKNQSVHIIAEEGHSYAVL